MMKAVLLMTLCCSALFAVKAAPATQRVSSAGGLVQLGGYSYDDCRSNGVYTTFMPTSSNQADGTTLSLYYYSGINYWTYASCADKSVTRIQVYAQFPATSSFSTSFSVQPNARSGKINGAGSAEADVFRCGDAYNYTSCSYNFQTAAIAFSGTFTCGSTPISTKSTYAYRSEDYMSRSSYDGMTCENPLIADLVYTVTLVDGTVVRIDQEVSALSYYYSMIGFMRSSSMVVTHKERPAKPARRMLSATGAMGSRA